MVTPEDIRALQKQYNEALRESQRDKAELRLSKAIKEGWLKQEMLIEDANEKPSVFVELAANYPDMFDRLRLVMAKPVESLNPAWQGVKMKEETGAGGVSDDEKIYSKIESIAKKRNIPYIEAAGLYNRGIRE